MGPHDGRRPDLRRVPTAALSPAEVAEVRALLAEAFWGDPEERFTEEDWLHALGGLHFVAELDGRIVGHASVVPRALALGGRPVRTGYVEAVATKPGLQGRGIGTQLLREVGEHIRQTYELGALGTGEHGFYERLGWRTWRGPSSVRAPGDEAGERPTPAEDGFIMVLATPGSGPLDLDAPISCEWRPGDVW